LSRGDPMIFLERPISAVLLGLTLVVLLLPLVKMIRGHAKTE